MMFNSYDVSYKNNTDLYFKLNIPKINLNKNVYKYESKLNNVNKGLFLVNNYNLNTLSGALIIASHSGNSSISYFKNLEKLKVNDTLYLEYNRFNYMYEINDIFKIDKTGKFNYNNIDKTIYLITCDKKNSSKQVVYRGKLVKITKKSTNS